MDAPGSSRFDGVTQALRSLRERRRAPSRRGGTARSSRRPGPAAPRRTTGLRTRYRPASPRAWPAVRTARRPPRLCFTDAHRLQNAEATGWVGAGVGSGQIGRVVGATNHLHSETVCGEGDGDPDDYTGHCPQSSQSH